MEKKEKINPVYSELQGYLSQTPIPEIPSASMSDSSIWNQYNETIDELNNISGRNYDRFKLQPLRGQLGPFIYLLTYRNKLGGLISRLHAEFFSDEPQPFSGMPTTIISQNQQQSQSFQIQMLLEIQSKIDEKILNFNKTTNERKFLNKLKSSLASITSITQLIAILLKLAQEFGLSIDQISKIFD